MWERFNKVLKGQMVTSIFYTVLGLCFILMPVSTVNVICKFVFGVVLILAGLYHIMIYVLEKTNATLLDLLSGGMFLVIGIFLFFNPQIVVKLLPVLLGTFVLVDSIWVLKGCLRLRKGDGAQWQFLLFGSLFFIVLGVAMIVNPFKMVKHTVIFAGAVMLANGIFDLIFMVMIRSGIKKLEEAEGNSPEDNEAVSEETFDVSEAAAPSEETQEPEYAPWSSRTARTESVQPEAAEIQLEKSAEQEPADTYTAETNDTEAQRTEPVVSDAEEYLRKQEEKLSGKEE